MKSILSLVTVLIIVVSVFLHESESFVFQDAPNGAACTTVDNLPGFCMSATDTQCTYSTWQWALKGITPKSCDGGTICCNRKSEENCLKYKPRFKRRRVFKRATVVGGTPAEEREFPFMAALGWTQPNGQVDFKCGGSLISENYVLTAAHCTSNQGIPFDVIRIGDKNLRTNAQSDVEPQTFGVAEIIRHPSYTFSTQYNDIALVKLSQPAVLNHDVRPVCLQSMTNIATSDVTVVGYGHTSFGGANSDELLKATVSMVSPSVCTQHYETTRKLKSGIVGTQMCAGDDTGAKDSCQGDSGGPLMDLTSDPPRLIGLTSFGKACASLTPSVYTRVSAYVDWIESVVWK